MKFFPGLTIMPGTSDEAKIYNKTIEKLNNLDYESSGGRYIKYPEQARVLRGKGTFERKSNFDGEDEFEISFSANEENLAHFIKLYHLACTLGILHIKDWNLFKTFFDHHLESLEQKTNLAFFDIVTPAGETPEKVRVANKDFFTGVRKKCDGNFMVLLKSFRINTLPETTNAYKITITVIPYLNCVNFIMRNEKFYENFYEELNKNYKNKIATFFNEIEDDYGVKDNKNFKFEFVNKNIIPSNEEITEGDIELMGTIRFELDHKYVDNFEIILNNNILKIPMQSGDPQFQNLGKAESSVTINMNFARSNLGKAEHDAFSRTVANLKAFTKMDQRDYYFRPVPEQHFLMKSLRLSSFSIQGLTNNDIESDEFQMSNISVLFLANSYGLDESFQNMTINDSKTPDKKLSAALKGFSKFLSFYINRTTSNIDKVKAELDRVKMLDRSLLSLINASARLFPPAIPKETYVYFHPNGEVGENKQISAGDIISPYQSSLIHAISLFVETGSDYTEKSKTYQFALNNLFYFPIYYVKGAIAKPDSPDYTMEGFLNFHIFRALMLMMTRHSPKKARDCKGVIDGVKIVFNSFLLEDEGQDGSLYNIAMSGIIAEHTSSLAREPDKLKVKETFRQALLNQIKVFRVSFKNTFGSTNDEIASLSKTGMLNTYTLVELHKSIVELHFKLNYDMKSEKVVNRLKALKTSMNYLSVFYSGFWPSSNNHLGRFERSLAESFANMVSVPLSVILTDDTFKKEWSGLSALFGDTEMKDLSKVTRINNQIEFNRSSDTNPVVGGKTFWDNVHISDLFDIALDADGKADKSNTSLIRSLAASVKEKVYYEGVVEDKDPKAEEITAEGLDEKTFEEVITKLFKEFGNIYTNTFDEANYMRYELGWNKSFNKLIDLMERDYQNILPIYHVEFANVDFITGLLNETPFMSLEKTGYTGKIVSVATNTNRTTKIKTAVIRMVDVENVQKSPATIGGNMTVGATDNVAKKGSKVFDSNLIRKAFPIRMGTLIRVYLGGSHRDVKNIFNGTVKSVEYENGFITVTCSNFASELYNGDVRIAAGKGGIGIFGTVASFKNIKNLLTTNDIANSVAYGKDYKEVLKKMLNSHSGLNSDKIAFPIVDLENQHQETAAQFIIGLTAVMYENSLPFLTTNNFSSFNDNATLSALKRVDEVDKNIFVRMANALATNEASRGNNDLLKNVYNVDFDFSTYGGGQYKTRLLPPYLADAIDIIIIVFGGKIFGAIAKGAGKIGMFVLKKAGSVAGTTASGLVVAPFKLGTKIATLLLGGEGKIAKFYTKYLYGKTSSKILDVGLDVVAKSGSTVTKKIFATKVMQKVINIALTSARSYVGITTLSQIPIVINGIISISAKGLMLNKQKMIEANKNNDSKLSSKQALNTSSYIPGILLPTETGYIQKIPADDGSLKTKTTGISFTYENKASMGNLLNDMERRYPGAEWDVMESGGFGTLFFGRNNYSYEYVPFSIKVTPYNYNKAHAGLKAFGSFKTEVIEKLKDPSIGVALNAATKTMRLLDAFNGFFTAGSVQQPEENKYLEVLKTQGNLKSTGLEQDGVQYFRNKIYAVSGKNLISCAIVTNDNFSNCIKVEYDTSLLGGLTLDLIGTFRKMISKDVGLSDFTLRSFWNLPDHFMRVKEIPKEFSRNTNSEFQAREQAAKWMEEEFKEYYDGKIVITYDGDVKRGSEIVICDSVNQIYGTVIAKEVSHVANAEMGLVTIITPGLKTEFKSPMASMTMTEVFIRTLDFLLEKNDLDKTPGKQKTREQIELMNNVIFAENIMPITYNFGFDMYYSERGSDGDPQGKGAASSINPLTNMLTQPLIIKPLYIKGKLAFPDELIYNAFSEKYDMVRVFWSGLDSMMYQGMMSIDIMGRSIFHSINGFITKHVRLFGAIMNGEDFSIILADMEYYDNVGANFGNVEEALKNATEGITVYGTTFDVQMAYEKGAGTRGMEYLESLEDITDLAKNLIENDTTIDKKNTKVGKAMLELNDIRIAEERLSNTDAAKFKPTSKDESKIPKNEGMALDDFLFPPNSGKEVTLNDKNDKLKKAMLTEGQIINDTEIKSIRNNYDSKRRIVYQSLQLLNFTDNYNKTGKGFPLKTWAILNGIAYVHREADVIVLTEVQEFITNGNPNGSIKNRLHLIKKLFNIYGNWEVVEQRFLKKNYNYAEYYLVFIRKASMYAITTVSYTEYKLGIGKSDRNILFLTEKWGKEKGDSEDKVNSSFGGKRYYPRKIAFCHTYFGTGDFVSNEFDSFQAKGKAIDYFFNIIYSEQPDIVMGDLNYEFKKKTVEDADTKNLPSYFDKIDIKEETTKGGRTYDNVLIRDRKYTTINSVVYPIGISNEICWKYSDHKGIMVEYDLYKGK